MLGTLHVKAHEGGESGATATFSGACRSQRGPGAPKTIAGCEPVTLAGPGDAVRRTEDEPLLRGIAQYLPDLDLGQLHAVFVRSSVAHARIEGIEFSGKTGSAQRISNDLRKSGLIAEDDAKDNGWFVGFAPRQNPEIVVSVLLEGGEHGALAAPIARDVIKSYFDKKLRISQTSPAQPPLALLLKPR